MEHCTVDTSAMVAPFAATTSSPTPRSCASGIAWGSGRPVTRATCQPASAAARSASRVPRGDRAVRTEQGAVDIEREQPALGGGGHDPILAVRCVRRSAGVDLVDRYPCVLGSRPSIGVRSAHGRPGRRNRRAAGGTRRRMHWARTRCSSTQPSPCRPSRRTASRSAGTATATTLARAAPWSGRTAHDARSTSRSGPSGRASRAAPATVRPDTTPAPTVAPTATAATRRAIRDRVGRGSRSFMDRYRPSGIGGGQQRRTPTTGRPKSGGPGLWRSGTAPIAWTTGLRADRPSQPFDQVTGPVQ